MQCLNNQNNLKIKKMGTRSTVKFFDGDNETAILSVYQQCDGYLSGVGGKLAAFLKDKKVINGIQFGQTMELGFANGMGCLAAQYVLSQKVKIGGFYITDGDDSQDYDYEVRFVDGELRIKVDEFEGTPKQLIELIEKGAA